MICENCGGSIKTLKRFHSWISAECENCKMSYAFRPDKQIHKKTLMYAFADAFETKMKDYKKYIKDK